VKKTDGQEGEEEAEAVKVLGEPLMAMSNTTSSRRMDDSVTGSKIILSKTLTKSRGNRLDR